MDDLAQRIGRHIARVREARGMQQVELADVAEMTRARLSDIEHGRYKNLGVGTLERLSRALDMTVKEFFDSLPGA